MSGLPTRGGMVLLDDTRLHTRRINHKTFRFWWNRDHSGFVTLVADEWDGYGRWIRRHSFQGRKENATSGN